MNKVPLNKLVFRAFCIFSLTLFCIWFILLMRDPKQFQIFFASGQNLFADFTNVMIYGAERNPYGPMTPGGGAEHAYLPLSYLITWMFAKPFPREALTGFDMWMNPQILILISLFFTAVAAMFSIQIYSAIEGKTVDKFLGFAAVMSSGLLISAFERGNLIILATVLTMFFIMNYRHENKIIRELSFIALAAAAALKMTPAIFGLLLVFNGKFKDAVRLVIYGVIMAVGPLVFIQGGFSNIPTLIDNIGLNVEAYRRVIGCGMRSVPLLLCPESETMGKLALYAVLGLAVIIVLSMPVMKKQWQVVLAIALLSIMLPGHSETYNALFLLPALIMMFNDKELKLYEALLLLPFLGMFCSIKFIEKAPRDYVCVLTSVLMIMLAFITSLPLIIKALKQKSYFSSCKSLIVNFFKRG